MFRPQAILGALVARFGSEVDPLSREEQRVAAAISSMLMSGREGELEFRQSDQLDEKIAKCTILDDESICALARKINREHKLVDHFKAAQTWVNSFKRNCGYSSRAINSWESPKSIKLADEIDAKANDLVCQVRSRMTHFPLSSIVNSDQSGVVKELYKARTIAKTGTKKVVCSVQRKTALTHSFTIMPTYFADGHLGTHLYVVLPEPKGKFPDKAIFNADNLVVRAARSHMMTKVLMVDWLETCVFMPGCPNELLLLVDSWSSFKDHPTMMNAAPAGMNVEIYNVPPGATSKIQPCDVTLFRQMKAFIKKITSHVRLNEIDFIVSIRDNTLKIVSMMYFVFCAPVFRPFLAYGWFRAGYVDERPDVAFLTPNQFCFNAHIDVKCEISGCANDHLLKCPYCHDFLCFDHFVVKYHRC